MAKLIDLIGKKFGKLEVLKRATNSKSGLTRWLCQCDCGNKTIVLSSHLTRSNTRSCGCLQKERAINSNTKHGHCIEGKQTKIYGVWQEIIQRCINPKHRQWKDYGGRGITICKRWMKFENFLEDMGECPPGNSIDRKNNGKGYFKDNCHWATRKQQQRNTRKNRLITFNGKNKCISEWAEEFNIHPRTLHNRIYKLGWSIEKALTIPVRKRRK